MIGGPDSRRLTVDTASDYIIRDNEGADGEVFTRRIHPMGIRNHPSATQSPWQNGYAERVIDSLRPKCFYH